LRTEVGLTQEALARRAKISSKFVSQIENGRSSPSADLLVRVVELGLGVPLAAFFLADDDTAEVAALLSGQSASTRKRALRVLRALCSDD
jgi:transcriptional regulator with XRE-family HTH domain